MATILYRMDETEGLITEMFDALRVQNAIENGVWFPTAEGARYAKIKMQNQEEETKEEKEENPKKVLTNKEVREAAKKAGIKGYRNRRIQTLEKELYAKLKKD